jgi:hypothetical protein
MPPGDERHTSRSPEAPERLVRDLQALHAGRTDVPREVDEAILAMARRQLERRPRVLVFRWAAAAAMAACVLIAVLLSLPGRHAPGPAHAARLALAREDFDGDGRVDILDAFALARAIEAGDERRTDWDINRDGRVDRSDVDAVAMAAVRLNGGPE